MSIGKILSNEQAMSLAVDHAQRGLGRVSPNPPVGAVIVNRQNQCLSVGYHKAHGMDHAEIMAIKEVADSDQLKEAVMYVTLEPCSYQGLTPACAEKITRLPFSKIYYGLQDPNPKVNGNGIGIIKKAGIQVEKYKGPLQAKLEELIEIYDYNLKRKKPFVGVKIASSLDGRITSKKQRWITNELSRNHVSFLRGCYDAVCIGVNTLIKDDPRLNSRHPDFTNQENQVVILDPMGQSFSVLKNSKLIQVRDPSKIIVVTQPLGRHPDYCTILEQKVDHQGLFDLDCLLDELFKRGIRSLLVEGGAGVFSSFLKKFQRIYLFLSPLLIGREGGMSWTESLSFDGASLSLKSVEKLYFGQDILITGRRMEENFIKV